MVMVCYAASTISSLTFLSLNFCYFSWVLLIVVNSQLVAMTMDSVYKKATEEGQAKRRKRIE